MPKNAPGFRVLLGLQEGDNRPVFRAFHSKIGLRDFRAILNARFVVIIRIHNRLGSFLLNNAKVCLLFGLWGVMVSERQK